ncbi:porin [Herbaspirillum sp. BH-1]|uniref:Porin n=1 Tax=Herbaspirillum frisingense TaxID=92645 RepID=A0ABU1PHG6_9BURK|nr:MULTISPECIES: porin [Herbaspirillum]MDR6584927.1 putative porin [Herbaspirillum frisingense]PLY60783.1 porin [Herbaspirillum sp. BH-1]QNB05853.1 porin [Herbaspirillum frisingense]UIN22065.1 porin [Herbaspirillum frisingense]
MKQRILAASIMAAAGIYALPASAQSSVTIYGLIDTGYVIETGGAAGKVNKLTSGISGGSRIGFKGTEDLGGGMSAVFLLESGFQNDTGALGQGGLLFGRQSYVGLNGGMGSVLVGRQYTPQYMTLAMVDPFGTGYAGDAANLMPNTGNSSSRMDNTVKYISPKVAGFTGELAYGFGETAGSTKAASQIGAAVQYSNGPLNVRLGFHGRNNDTTTAETSSGRSTLLGAVYDFGVLKLHGAYGINKGVNSSPLRSAVNSYGTGPVFASTDSADMLIGVTVPFGVQHTVLASYIHKNDKTARNQDANQVALGYRYSMSKRTDLYAMYAHISNKNGAPYTVGSSIETGSGNSAWNFGIRHTF